MSANEQYENYRLGTGQAFDRLFIVEDPTDKNGNDCDPIFDNELLTKAAPGTSLWDRQAAIAGRPRVTWSDGTTHTVTIPYAAPSGLQGSGLGSAAWKFRISGNLGSVRTDTERRTLEEIEEKTPPKIVGPFVYTQLEDTTDYANSPDGNEWAHYKAGSVLLVYDPIDGQRKPIGMDIMTPNASITYRRLCADNNARRVNEIIYRHGYVNDDDVRLPGLGGNSFLPGQLLLDSYEITEVTSDDINNPLVHDLSVTFAANSEGWQFDYYHTWTDPNITGVDAAIVKYDTNVEAPEKDGQAVKERFRRQFETSFNGWLESIQ